MVRWLHLLQGRRPVQQKPVQTQVFDGGGKSLEDHGLDDVTIDAEPQFPLQLPESRDVVEIVDDRRDVRFMEDFNLRSSGSVVVASQRTSRWPLVCNRLR